MNYNHPVEILVVEDNPDDLEMIIHALNSVNIINHIVIARDGVEALDLLFCRNTSISQQLTNPGVILLDVKLPKLDGLEVLRQIKADPTTQALPVVILTSSQEQRDIVESYKLGANSYIVKPVEFSQFLAAIKHLGFYWMLLNQRPM